MSSDLKYHECEKCHIKIEIDALCFHNCEYEKKIKEVEEALQIVLDENLKCKTQNDELKKSVVEITKDIKASFDEVNGIVESLQKNAEAKKKKKLETEEAKEKEKLEKEKDKETTLC